MKKEICILVLVLFVVSCSQVSKTIEMRETFSEVVGTMDEIFSEEPDPMPPDENRIITLSRENINMVVGDDILVKFSVYCANAQGCNEVKYSQVTCSDDLVSTEIVIGDVPPDITDIGTITFSAKKEGYSICSFTGKGVGENGADKTVDFTVRVR